jgi:hypothetical protein
MLRRTCNLIACEGEPRGGALDVAWPCTPVAHLAFETDTHFATIDCSSL